MNPGHIFNCEETYGFLSEKSQKAGNTRVYYLGSDGYTAFKEFVKKALPYRGPVPASPSRSLTPEEHTHGPTNAGTPGAGITQPSEEPDGRQPANQPTIGTRDPITPTIEGQAPQASCYVRARSSQRANPRRNTWTEANRPGDTGPGSTEQANYPRDTGAEAPEQATVSGHTATRNATYRGTQGPKPLSEPLRHSTQQQASQPNR